MKTLSWISRMLVGALFIVSGLIKANDAVGFSFKLEEYFTVFGTPWMSNYALILAAYVCILEIILGVAVIFGTRMVTVSWLLLLMIVFFTFLTFYSAYFNKVTDCGCFGDAIKLTPWESFSKDIILLVMIVVLPFTKRDIPGKSNQKLAGIVTGVFTVLALGVGIYANLHEPFIDFRAYKTGNDLPALMKPSEPLRYKYIMEKNGERKEFETYPTDTTWVYKEMVPLNPEAGPKITDFSVWNDEGT